MDIRADIPAQKLSPHRSERRKIKFFCADVLDPKVRTSMTQGVSEKLYAGKLWAAFSALKSMPFSCCRKWYLQHQVVSPHAPICITTLWQKDRGQRSLVRGTFLRVMRGCQASQREGLTLGGGGFRATSGQVWGTSGEVWETDCSYNPE